MLRDGKRPGDAGWAVEPQAAHGVLTALDGDHQEEKTTTVASQVGSYEVYYKSVAQALQSGDFSQALVDAKDVVAQIGILQDAKRHLRVNLLHPNSSSK